MDVDSLEELREELASLEAAEALISAKRRHLHQQIDFGFASEETRAREREISDERRQLHRRIDALPAPPKEPLPSTAKARRPSAWRQASTRARR